jgi:hypothetical protein
MCSDIKKHIKEHFSFEEAGTDRLVPHGQPNGVSILSPGDKMYSWDRKYFMEYTMSGNLRLVIAATGREYWNSNRSAQYPLYAIMQIHGNFVCWASYRADLTGPTYDYWETPTRTLLIEHRAPGYIVMQGDGNLVVYDKNNVAVWATGTVNPR